jgi:hypothetical protein
MKVLPAWMPNEGQLMLLRACLLEEAPARDAWRRWRASVDVQHLDNGCYRLVPLLWKRLSSWRVDDPDMGTFKGVYRRTWYTNQLTIARAGTLVSGLAAAGIPSMVIKGAAISLRYYQDAGLRPMNDVDLAVPRDRVQQAIDVLFNSGWRAGITPLTGTQAGDPTVNAGWKGGPRPRAAFDELYFGVRHAHGFRGPQGAEVDLHWALFQGQCDPGIDDAMWQAAEPMQVGASTAFVMRPEDELLLTVSHAARACPVPTIRWVADAVTLIHRAGAELDWSRLVEHTRRRDLGLIAGTLLGWLEEEFHPGVPRDVLAALRGMPAGPARRWAYRIRVSPPSVWTGLEELRYLRRRHKALRRQLDANGQPLAVPGFLRFTEHILGADDLPAVARYAARESIRRLRTG